MIAFPQELLVASLPSAMTNAENCQESTLDRFALTRYVILNRIAEPHFLLPPLVLDALLSLGNNCSVFF